MHYVAAVLGLVLVGLPLVVTPSWVIVAPAAVAALLIAVGIVVLSTPLVTAGIAVGLVEYTLALWIGARPLDPLTAVALGAALVLLLQVVDFARRFRGATVDAAVATSQARYWLGTGILGVVVALVVTGLATGLAPALPPAAYPALAAAGALIAVIGVARVIGEADAVEVMPAPLAGHGATESGTSTHLR
jgi:hypothetical protein